MISVAVSRRKRRICEWRRKRRMCEWQCELIGLGSFVILTVSYGCYCRGSLTLRRLSETLHQLNNNAVEVERQQALVDRVNISRSHWGLADPHPGSHSPLNHRRSADLTRSSRSPPNPVALHPVVSWGVGLCHLTLVRARLSSTWLVVHSKSYDKFYQGTDEALSNYLFSPVRISAVRMHVARANWPSCACEMIQMSPSENGSLWGFQESRRPASRSEMYCC